MDRCDCGLIGPFYLPFFHTHTVFDSQICEMSQFQYQHTRGGWNAGLEYWVRCRFEFQSQYKIHCSIRLRGNRIISFCVTISFQLGCSFFSLLIFPPETFTGLSTFSISFSLPQLDLAICNKSERKPDEIVSWSQTS